MVKDYLKQYTQDYKKLSKVAGLKQPTASTRKGNFRGLTSEDLLRVAQENGMGAEAQAVLDKKGEDSNEIFSGGFISDIFDGINALQYGIVGMMKGKTFSEGVKTRQSFSDQDALGEFGLPGTITGILLDIAFDPFTYIAPWTIMKKVPGMQKLGQAGVKAAMATKAGDWAARKFIWMGGQMQAFKDGFNRMTHGVAAGWAKGKRLGQALDALDPDGALLYKAFAEGDLAKISKVGGSAPEAFKAIGEIQEQLLTKGIITQEMYDASVGHYLPRLYELFESSDLKRLLNSGMTPEELTVSLMKGGKTEEQARALINSAAYFDGDKAFKQLANDSRMNLDRLKTKHDAFGFTVKDGDTISTKKFATSVEKDRALAELTSDATFKGRITENFAPIPEEYLEAMGEIQSIGYPVAKTIGQLNEMAAKADMFSTFAKTEGLVSNTIADGMLKLPVNRNLGELSGKYMHRAAAEYMTAMVTPQKVGGWQKVVAGFKFGKVILNPATHARNIASNLVLNNMEGMLLSNPRTWKNYGRAMKEIGSDGKWIREMKEVYGVGLDGMASQEITSMLGGPDGLEVAGGLRKAWRRTFGKVNKGMAKLYETEETMAKVAAFMHHAETMGAKKVSQLKRLATIEDLAKFDIVSKEALTIGDVAARVAERATFNYAQVSPFVRHLRSNIFGMPFITFSAKATPQVAKTLVKHPARLSWIGKVKNAIEDMSDIKTTARERASEPQWVRDGLYIKLPMKDKHGRSAYFDLTYVIPFGDVISGQIFERQVDRDTGLPESYAEGLGKKSPVFNLITEIGKNQDFYGNKIWRDSDSSAQQLADLTRHLSKTYLPPLLADMLPGGYLAKGKNKGKRRPSIVRRALGSSADNQYRTGMQEFMRNAGIKIQPVNADIQENYMEFEKKKALETMLGEAGILKTYERAYLKKK